MNFIHWNPTKFLVSAFILQPMHQILQFTLLSSINLEVEYLRYFEFLFPIDFHQRWWQLSAVGYHIRHAGFEHGNVEDRVNCAECVGKFQCVRLRARLSNNLKRAFILVGQSMRQVGGAEVLFLDKDLLINLQQRGWSAISISRILIIKLDCSNILSELLIQGIKICD